MRLMAILAMLITSAIVVAVGIGNPPGDANNPINIVAFPQRDFISASGYLPDDRVVVKVIHDQTIYPGTAEGTTYDGTTNSWIAPVDATDPATADGGIVEVNHPGGACWVGHTPDIRPGDTIQIQIVANASDPSRIDRIDETVVQNIVAKRPVQTGPGTIQIHGSAQTSFSGVPPGLPLPIGVLEQRLVAPGELFDLNNKRTLRADATGTLNGTLSYDQNNNPNGINWTATYTGLTAADVSRALSAESRGMWLGNAILPAGEITTFEIGAGITGGPQAPCNAPKEILPPPPGVDSLAPSMPTGLTAQTLGSPNSVTLNWNASTDTENGVNDNPGVTSYGIYRASGNSGIFIEIANVQKPDGTAPAPITYVDRNVPPGTYRYKVDAADSAGNRSAQSLQSDPTVTTDIRPDPNPADINEPPANGHALLAFPSRDFVSAEGYIDAEEVTIEIIRNGAIISNADAVPPDAEGLVEVNHPGGACWDGITPELRAGDIVRATAYRGGNVISVDQIHVANVTATKAEQVTAPGVLPATLRITGTAQDINGLPIPIDQIEQRLVGTSRDPFNLNDRRALRADSSGAGDGALSYDEFNNPTGIKWTATYTLETQHDVNLALEVESRVLWLGRDPLVGNELTLFENGLADPPGPAIGFCSAAIEPPDQLPPSVPLNFSANVTNASTGQVTFGWTASSDEWGVAGYRLYDGGTEVAIAPPNATQFVLNNVAPGNHVFTLRAVDNASALVGVGDFATQITAGLGQRYGNDSAAAVLTTVNGQPSGDGTVTLTDIVPPTAPTNLIGVARDGGIQGVFIDLTWTASTDNIGVVKYVVHRSPSQSGPGADIDVAGNVTAYTDTLNAAGSRNYFVSACDAAGLCTDSASITVNIPNIFDNVAPNWPANSSVTAVNVDIHTKNVTATWTAALDNVLPSVIARYDVFRANNGNPTGAAAEKIATVAGNLLQFNDVVPAAGTYRYAVIAYDEAGNATPLSPISNAVIVANDVPVAGHSVIGFPSRDFISASGYNFTPQHAFHFELIRGVSTFTSASIENALGDTTGTVEVNHPGGTCWNVTTPDIRPGDVIRIVDETTGIADQTTVSNVTAERPIAINATTVVIRGTAQQANGQPIPVGQLEQRLVSAGGLFEKNGSRTLRAAAGADGTLVYDTINNPTGIKWTATYTGLSANDMLRAVGGTNAAGVAVVGSESRIVWLGRAPLAGTELTIFENGPEVTGGPSAPCTAAAETAVPEVTFTPASINFGNQSFTPATTSAAQTVTFRNTGTAPMTLINIYFAGINPGEFSRPALAAGGTCPTAFPATLAAGASCTVNVQFSPLVQGLRQAYLNFTDNAANTTDQSVQLTGTGIDDSDPRITLTANALAFGTVNAGNVSARSVTVTNLGTGTRPLVLSGVSVTGANLADFTIAPTSTCVAGTSLPTNASCTVNLVFSPRASGARAATLSIGHNRALPNSATSTSVALTGTGGAGAVLSLNGGATFSFTNVTRNTNQTKSLSVRNTGNATTTPTFSIGGADAAQFTIVSQNCANLAAGRSCSVNLRFTAPNAVRSFAATLSATAANALPTTRTINLTATTR